MKLSELITKLQHEQVHAQARGADPVIEITVLERFDGGEGPQYVSQDRVVVLPAVPHDEVVRLVGPREK